MSIKPENIYSDALLKDCLDGKRMAQNKLYEMLAPKMMTVCLRYTKTNAEAQDILQEGFIRVFSHLHTYRQSGSFEGWVARIMVNCALQHIRRKTLVTPMYPGQDEKLVNLPDPVQPGSGLDAHHLLSLIRRLPRACQAVFNLFVFEEMTHKEIAAALHISEGTSKSNLHDARKLLQQYLQAFTDTQLPQATGTALFS